MSVTRIEKAGTENLAPQQKEGNLSASLTLRLRTSDRFPPQLLSGEQFVGSSRANSGLIGIGQAGAAGAAGAANSSAQGLSNMGSADSGLGGSLQQNLLLNKLIGGGSGFGAGGTTYTPTNPTADYRALFPNG
jgi:hypothetical protein